MTRRQIVECEFLIPLRRDAKFSDGALHSTEAWTWLTDELYERFRGYTVAPGLCTGVYEDPDEHESVADESRKYVVAVRTDEVNELRSILIDACGVFQQKCVYLSVGGIVEFIEASADE